ncbi:Uncharacterised protein [Mycobacteroides abscessus subsp. abscessus]|nr:Uncharacterised protein [Mycobacteroides abscessus subsp. abscessus]
MKELILFLANIVNYFHDLIWDLADYAGLKVTDKDLHLWVFGIIGIATFFMVHQVFKTLAKYSITSISFIYTFTVILVLVFAIEIQQKITGRGKMDFNDAIISLWGFLLFFAVYLIFKGIFIGAKGLRKKKKKSTTSL